MFNIFSFLTSDCGGVHRWRIKEAIQHAYFDDIPPLPYKQIRTEVHQCQRCKVIQKHHTETRRPD